MEEVHEAQCEWFMSETSCGVSPVINSKPALAARQAKSGLVHDCRVPSSCLLKGCEHTSNIDITVVDVNEEATYTMLATNCHCVHARNKPLHHHACCLQSSRTSI